MEHIAPFMNRDHLNQLAKKAVEKDGIKAISPIAPFLSTKLPASSRFFVHTPSMLTETVRRPMDGLTVSVVSRWPTSSFFFTMDCSERP